MFDSVIPPWVASTATAWLLTYALHSTLLLGIAWLASRRLAGRSPLAEEAVWRAAMIGALVTASLQVAGGWEPLGGSWKLNPPEEVAAVAPAPAFELRHVSLPASRTERQAQPVEAVTVELAPASSSTPVASPVDVPGAVLGLWFGGVLLVGLGSVRGYVLLRRRLRHRPQVIGGHLFEQLRRLAGEAGLREVRLGCSSRVPVPVALGGRRPEVCVPPRALAALTAEQQEGMLAHELAHLVRRDPFWLAFTNLMTALFFFQPLQWVARRRLREISETLCDAWAVERTGRPLSLAQCLAEVAGWSLQPLGALPVASMADRPSHLSHRIRRLLEDATPEGKARRRWLAIAMVALVLVVAAAAPGVSAAVRTDQSEAALEDAADLQDDLDEDFELSEAEEEALEGLSEEIERAVEPALEAAELVADLHDDETLEALAELGELGELGEHLDALEDLGEELGQLGELGALGALAEAHAAAQVEFSEEELEEISRNAEKIAERVQALMGPEMERIHEDLGRKMEALHDQMPTAEMKRLEAEMEALSEKMQPSEEDMERLHAEIDKLRQEGKLRGEQLSKEDRERLRAEAKRMSEQHRMSAEDREKMRELARQHREEARRFMEVHRPEIEAAQREAREQSRIVREQFERRIEEDPELRALRERHRQEMERYRSKMREDRKNRYEGRKREGAAPVAPVPPAPPVSGVAPTPPTPRPSAVPAPRAPRAPRATSATPAVAPTPRPARMARPALAPAPPAPTPPTPAVAPAPRVAPTPAVAPAPSEAPPAETPAPPPAPEPPADFV